MLSLRLPKDIEERLERLARETGRTKTYYAKEAIIEHIEDLEDAYLSMRALEKPGRIWSLEEVEEDLEKQKQSGKKSKDDQ